MIVRTKQQPTVERDLEDAEVAVLEHQGLVWHGTDDELAAHYRDAGIDLPPTVKPTAVAAAGKSTDQAKGA